MDTKAEDRLLVSGAAMAMTKRRIFTVGSMIGWALSAGVVLTGSVDVFTIPTWQRVLFYPGFVAGFAFYDCCRGWFSASWEYNASLFVGVLTVGLSYGVIALGLLAFVTRFLNRQPGQNFDSKRHG